MNLVAAIQEVEKQLGDLDMEYASRKRELQDGLRMLRKMNTTCERCNGKGKYMRPRACAEDDMTRDYITCEKCHGTGKAKR